MNHRYLLCPGNITSCTDGDRHYITADKLADLYGVQIAACIVFPEKSPANHSARMALLDRVHSGELVALTPSYTGDYTLPAAAAAAEMDKAMP